MIYETVLDVCRARRHQRWLSSISLGLEAVSLCESIAISLTVGLTTGMITSHFVARRFYKKALLDDCSRLLRRVCPYRRLNVREGDGLEETSWALKIQSEIMHRLFSREAREIEALSTEIAAASEIDSSKEEERQARDHLKETWNRRLAALY